MGFGGFNADEDFADDEISTQENSESNFGSNCLVDIDNIAGTTLAEDMDEDDVEKPPVLALGNFSR